MDKELEAKLKEMLGLETPKASKKGPKGFNMVQLIALKNKLKELFNDTK